MKKTKILVPAVAVLALGLAASVTGTVAWYQSAAATVNDFVAGTSNVVTTNGVTSTDSFRVTASIPTAPGAVRLTNSTGQTYLTDGTNNFLANDPTQGMAAVAVKLTVLYTGSNTSLDDVAIRTLWETTISSKISTKVVCHDATDYTSTTAPTSPVGNSPKAIKDGAGANNYGLKFADSGSDYDNVGDVEVSFNKASLTGVAFSSKSAEYVLTDLCYVGVWGIDSFIQLAGDTYTMQVTPAIA